MKYIAYVISVERQSNKQLCSTDTTVKAVYVVRAQTWPNQRASDRHY